MAKKKKTTLAAIALKADAYKALRTKRLDLSHQVDELKKEETQLMNELIEVLSEQGVEGVQGKTCRVSLNPSIVPIVVDWDKLNKYILKNEALEFFQQRLSVTAVRDRWDAGEKVPGVKEDTKIKLKVNKT